MDSYLFVDVGEDRLESVEEDVDVLCLENEGGAEPESHCATPSCVHTYNHRTTQPISYKWSSYKHKRTVCNKESCFQGTSLQSA